MKLPLTDYSCCHCRPFRDGFFYHFFVTILLFSSCECALSTLFFISYSFHRMSYVEAPKNELDMEKKKFQADNFQLKLNYFVILLWSMAPDSIGKGCGFFSCLWLVDVWGRVIELVIWERTGREVDIENSVKILRLISGYFSVIFG